MRVLADQDVVSGLEVRQLIETLREAFKIHYHSFRVPARTFIASDSSAFLVMSCGRDGLFGVKVAVLTRYAGRTPRVHKSTYTLYDESTGAPLVFAEADSLTELRTAATSAVATDALARKDASVLGIFGTGRLAPRHVQFLTAVRDFKDILICGNSLEKSWALADQVMTRYRVSARAVDARTCAAESHVICTCTTSVKPLFDGNVLQPGTHLNLVGAFTPDAREVDTRTVVKSRVVVDTYDGALSEGGDLLIPLREAAINRSHIVADLHEVLSGKKPGRRHETDITLFKSVGSALEDLAAAEMLQLSFRTAST